MNNVGITLITKGAKALANNPEFLISAFGTYSDGTPRCMVDALTGEYVSPSDKKKMLNKAKKNKKSKK